MITDKELEFVRKALQTAAAAGAQHARATLSKSEEDLVATLGVQTAYNLDGGDSTLLYFFDDRINVFSTANKARPLTDIIYFASAEE